MPKSKARTARIVQPTHAEAHIKTGPDADLVRRRAIYEALREMGEVIYAIRCDDGLIKIGFTGGMRERRRTHGVAFTSILAVTPGTYAEEQQLHRNLRPHLARGREYYHPAGEVLAYVNEIRRAAGVPAV